MLLSSWPTSINAATKRANMDTRVDFISERNRHDCRRDVGLQAEVERFKTHCSQLHKVQMYMCSRLIVRQFFCVTSTRFWQVHRTDIVLNSRLVVRDRMFCLSPSQIKLVHTYAFWFLVSSIARPLGRAIEVATITAHFIALLSWMKASLFYVLEYCLVVINLLCWSSKLRW